MLKIAAQEIPIISVSQEPIDLGTNICVGDLGISWKNIYLQLSEGLKATKTKYVAIAEHDCLYTNEHFRFIPANPNTFYYNHNAWLVQWKCNHAQYEGMYSYWPRRYAQSQVVCFRESLLQNITERLVLVEAGLKGFRWAGEAGMFDEETWKRVKGFARWAISGRSVKLTSLVEDHIKQWKHGTFNTVAPNLDIRHKTNFTGPKRGKKRTFTLPPWGRFEDYLKTNGYSGDSLQGFGHSPLDAGELGYAEYLV